MCLNPNEDDVILARWHEAERAAAKLRAAVERHRRQIYGLTDVDFEPDVELYSAAGLPATISSTGQGSDVARTG